MVTYTPAVLIVEYSPPINMTVANGTGIERGTCLTLSDPLTAAAATNSTAAVAGIAAEEKIASDGKTKISVYRDGIFKLTCSGAVTVGDKLAWEYNTVSAAQINHEHTCGIALETGADKETILIELQPNHNNLA